MDGLVNSVPVVISGDTCFSAVRNLSDYCIGSSDKFLTPDDLF